MKTIPKNILKIQLVNLFLANKRDWSIPFLTSKGDPINAPRVPRLSTVSSSTFGLTMPETNPMANPITNAPQVW